MSPRRRASLWRASEILSDAQDSQSSQASEPLAPAPVAGKRPSPVATRRMVLPSGASRVERSTASQPPAKQPRLQPQPQAQPQAVQPEQPLAESEAPHVEESPPVEVWKVLGDCRCLFRAVMRGLEDPCNRVPRDASGEALDEKQRLHERERAAPGPSSLALGSLRTSCDTCSASVLDSARRMWPAYSLTQR